ncbi:hypothetical protein [Streptomyces microflavus]|uniref:hypothetical protein n=1 Tax=Streptomyces microflavus TaxID=1919 RepID=UPI0033BC8EBB
MASNEWAGKAAAGFPSRTFRPLGEATAALGEYRAVLPYYENAYGVVTTDLGRVLDIRHPWIQAGDLKPGQELEDGKGEPARILDVIAYTAERTTYDLSVEGLQTYGGHAGPCPQLRCRPPERSWRENGPAVGIKKLKMALGRAGMSVANYDIVHVPVIRTSGDGLPTYANSPTGGSGIPNQGPRGRPLIQISDMGLADMDTAVVTVFHEVYHQQMYVNRPRMVGGSHADDFGY